MATLQLVHLDDAWDRAEALGRIAARLLSARILCCLLVVVWLALGGHTGAALLALCVLNAGLLLALLRWSTIGRVLTRHPAVLAVDLALGFFVVASCDPPDPSILVVGTGALLIGLCLGRTGALIFCPLMAAVWWAIYTRDVPDGLSAPGLFSALVLTPAFLVAATVVGVAIRHTTLDTAEKERGLRDQVRAAGVAEERARLAREMHDSLVKSLHGVAMMADALPRWVDADPDRARQQAAAISSLLDRSARESRELIVAMRRAPAGATLTEVVEGIVDRWRTATGRSAVLEVRGAPELPTESSYELAAILGEALENVSRHTPVTATARVGLADDEGWVVLLVSDDGGGPVDGLSRDGHFGVIGMRERAERVGGRFTVKARDGQGVSVLVRVPAAQDTEENHEHEGVPR